MPDSAPIFFSVDEDIDLNTWKSVAVEWFRGINSVLGVDRTGIYGHAQACGWAIDDGVIGRSTTARALVGMADQAWSHGEREPAAVLYQAVVVTAVEPGCSSWAGPMWMWTTFLRPISGSGISIDDLAGAGLHHGA